MSKRKTRKMLTDVHNRCNDQLDDLKFSEMLVIARRHYLNAFGLAAAIAHKTIPFSTEDLMQAYQMANDWLFWFETPKAEGCPLGDKDADYSDQAKMMRMYVCSLGGRLMERQDEVEKLFNNLDPSIVEMAKREISEAPQHLRQYLKALRTTAEAFDRWGYSTFLQAIS